MTTPALTHEHQEAIKQQEALCNEIARAEEEKCHLLYHVKPYLESRYLVAVGNNRLELLRIQTTVFRLKLKLEKIQAAINRDDDVNEDLIDELIELEMQEHLKQLKKEAEILNAASMFINLEKLTEEEIKEIKLLYYKLAKQLHPDIYPGDINRAALWLKLSEAYSLNDLEAMRALAAVAELSLKSEDLITGVEQLKKKNEQLAAYFSKLIQKLQEIKVMFPFTISEYIEDQGWVNNENNETLNAISACMDEKATLEKMIQQLLNNEQ